MYVDKNDLTKVVRYWQAGEFKRKAFEKGWMVPHPTFFVKKEIYEKYGDFNTNFSIAADYEMILRLLYKHGIPTHYIPKILVKMRQGGISNRSFINMVRKSIEDYKVCKVHGIQRSCAVVIGKNLIKLPQFFMR